MRSAPPRSDHSSDSGRTFLRSIWGKGRSLRGIPQQQQISNLSIPPDVYWLENLEPGSWSIGFQHLKDSFCVTVWKRASPFWSLAKFSRGRYLNLPKFQERRVLGLTTLFLAGLTEIWRMAMRSNMRNHQCFIAMWPLIPSANCVRIGWPDPWNLAWGAAGSKSEGVQLGSRNAQCLLSPLRYAKLLQDIQAPIRVWVLQLVWTLKKLKGRWLAARETNSWYSATHRCTTPI